MTRVNIDLPDDMHKQAKFTCVLRDSTLIEYINRAIDDKIKKAKL